FKDAYHNAGAKAICEIATRTNDVSGDGTTTPWKKLMIQISKQLPAIFTQYSASPKQGEIWLVDQHYQ
ncbi:MAG: hypothetical protein Q8807_04010, partial ['Waltheria sp.' little leaf phytoplasma]|nr:hypothetical protein ['Waltheria sp.' little leaf phytoplasma]